MASRYQVRTLHAQQGDVTTYEGVDPLTGLPVLIYQFRGRAAAGLRDLESENIPGLLEVDVNGNDTQVVVAYFKDYRPVSQPLSVPVETLLLDSARALNDAADAGVIHGDIRPERFFSSRDHVLLEGFGVPWLPESSYQPPEATVSFAGDVYALSKSLLELTQGSLGKGATAALNAGLAKQPNERLSAAELYSALQRPTPRAAAPIQTETYDETAQAQSSVESSTDAQSFADEELTFGVPPTATPEPEPVTDFSIGFDDEPSGGEAAEFGNAFASGKSEYEPPVSESSAPSSSDPFSGEEPVIPLNDTDPAMFLSEADERPKASGESVSGEPVSELPPTAVASRVPPTVPPALEQERDESFVKDLPPGATYRAGDSSATQARPALVEEYSFDDEPERNQTMRRALLLGVLLVLVATLAFLIFYVQQRRNVVTTPPPAETGTVGATLVSVLVTPDDLPPVDLYVVNSPAGSRTPPGSILTRLNPGRNDVTLDQEGVWQFQARFQNRVSDVATLTLPAPPEERTITLDVPPPPDEQEP